MADTNDYDVMADLRLAIATITAKTPRITLLFNYYKGFQPLKYSAERLRKAFEDINVYFSQNWIAVIADAVLDRLVLKGFDVTDNDKANKTLDELWKNYNLQLVADDVHESYEVVGEGYIIALLSDNDNGETEYDIYHNDPRLCHVFYDGESPNVKRFAAKMWLDGSIKQWRMVLYYPDRFYYFIGPKQQANQVVTITENSFSVDGELPEEINPYSLIPVFHFKDTGIAKRRDLGPSEISLQDAINKLLTDMMVSAEFNTFIQRVIISQADPGNLQNVAGSNWWIPAGDSKGQQTSVQELGGRALNPFLEAIDKLATSLGIISRTPKHYFFSQAGDPSGEALIAMEAPLNKKTKKKQERLSVEWTNFAQFLLQLEEINDVKRSQIVSTWEPVETVQPKTSSEIVKMNVDSGIPLKTSLRKQGWTNDELKQLDEDKAEEKKQMSGLAQTVLDELRKQDAQNNNNPVSIQPATVTGNLSNTQVNNSQNNNA